MDADYLARAHILKYHKDSIKTFGADSNEALGWKKKENQQARFRVFLKLGKLHDATLLDVGCANGDLLQFFREQNIQCQYTGIDQVKEFIELAAEKYKEETNASFLLGDFWSAEVGQFDYVIASGALSYRHPDPNFIYRMIFRLYSLSNMAFGFNLLENVTLKSGGLVAYDKNTIVAYCQKICPNVIVTDKYLEDDFTVMMYKSDK